MPALPRRPAPVLAPLLVVTLALTACTAVAPPAAAPPAAAPAPADAPAAPPIAETPALAPTPSPPAAQTPATTAPAAQAPAGATLTRAGVQSVTLDLRNGTPGTIVELNVVVAGANGPNLLPAGMGIPPGGTFPLPVAVGRYLLRAELQAPSVFTPAQQVLRHVIVPRFPPNPAPRMTVTLR